MKQIQYIMTDRSGKVKTFRIRCQQNESDDKNLELFAPDKLRGYAATRIDQLVGRGFSLSNWHVIEAEDCSRPIATRAARIRRTKVGCKGGVMMGGNA